MRIVSIINQKGGCGKTTTAINLAGIMARRGYRTLLVDLDPQSHCAAGLAVPEPRIDLDIGDAMLTDPPSALNPKRLLWRVAANLDLAPSRTKLAGLEAARGGLADRADKERRLLGVLHTLSAEYDLCLIDCSPSIGLLTYNALAAATDLVIPVETSFFALQGATKQVSTIKTMARRLGMSPRYWLVGTIHDQESVLSCDLLAELRRRFGDRVSPVTVHRDQTLKDAASFGQPVIEYQPLSRGAQDYLALADWLIRVMGLAPGSMPLDLPEIPLDGDFTLQSATEAHPPELPPQMPEPQVTTSRVEDMAALARSLLLKRATSAPAAAATETMESPVAVAEPPPLPVAAPIAVPARAGQTPLTLVEAKPTPVSAVARELLGVTLTRAGALFVQPLSIGGRVSLAGDFNAWSASSHVLRRNEEHGVWELCVPLPPGTHQYRLVVDGRWIVDPNNARTVPNQYHEINSVVEVSV
jgi:chromosome partitioning protein